MIDFSGLTEFYEARGGERSPESDYGLQNRDARIHVGCTGCITRPFHSCDMLRRLQEVHVQHTGDLYAGSADTLCWTRFPMNCPSRRSTVISSTGGVAGPGLVDKLVHGPNRRRGP